MSEATETKAVAHYEKVGMASIGAGGGMPAVQSMAEAVSVAQLMARSGIAIRKHLRDNPGACLGVLMQALRWEFDPYMVGNKSYAVNDQLAYEAQLLAAVVLTRSAIVDEPDYTYEGEPFKTRTCTVTFKMKSGKSLSYTTPETAKITPKNSPLWKSDEDQQLGYYAIRSWARRHQPQVLLGCYTPDEASSNIIDVTPQGSGVMERLQKSDKAADGFDPAHVARETEKPASEAPAASGDVVECEHEFEGEGDDAACKHCGQLEADARPGAAEDAPAKAGPADTTLAPEAIDGPAPNGVAYLMFGDAYVKDRRLTYKDGERFSSVGPIGAAKLKAYTEHAPELVAEAEVVADNVAEAMGATEDEADLDQPCDDCGAAAGEDCKPDCPGLIEAGGAAQPEPETVAEPEPETGFLATLAPMKSWPDEFKPAVAALFKTSDYQGAPEDEKNELRAAIWARVIASGAKVDQADEPSAYGLWLAAQGNSRDDADAVEGTFRVLQGCERWSKMSEAARKPLEDRTAAKLKSIRGKA